MTDMVNLAPGRPFTLVRALRSLAAAALLPALILLLSNAWALQYICAKLMGENNVPVFGGLFAVHVMMIIVFGIVLVSQGWLFRLTLARTVFFIYAAGIGNVVSLGAELMAAPHIPAGLLAIILSMAPVFTLLFTVLLRTETLTPRRVLGVLLGLAAALLILLPYAHLGGDGFVWILIAFIGPLAFGAMAVIIWAAWPKGLSAMQVAFGNAVAGLVLVAPFAWVEGFELNLSNGEGLAALAMAGFTVTLIIEYWLFALIIKKGGAVYASCSDFGTIAFGLVWAWAFFSEIPTGWMLAAATLCVISLLIAKKAQEAEG
jgi:drug/metabolite transporter (DMT)-like permease